MFFFFLSIVLIFNAFFTSNRYENIFSGKYTYWNLQFSGLFDKHGSLMIKILNTKIVYVKIIHNNNNYSSRYTRYLWLLEENDNSNYISNKDVVQRL